MLEFHPLNREVLDKLRAYMGHNPDRLCDLTLGGIFIWRDYYKTEYAIHEGILYFKVEYPGFGTMFTLPQGGDRRREYRQIMDYCARRGLRVCFCPIPEQEVGPLVECFPGAQLTSDRNTYDYLYRAEDLKYFKGKKLSGQRNHVNRFLRTYENWSFGPIGREDLADVQAFLDRYAQAVSKDSGTFQEDIRKSREVLEEFEACGMIGGVLRVDGQVTGFSIGEVVGDTLFIHIEKADRTVEGCYQMLVSQFAQRYATEGVDYINREDDTGDPGLRTSKLSYQPVALLEKYAVLVPDEPCDRGDGTQTDQPANSVFAEETNN